MRAVKALGVEFKQEPTNMGPVAIAVFADTRGNLIQLLQPARSITQRSRSDNGESTYHRSTRP
jgi:hypothetical protein